jgi:hypothetical protein
MGRPAVGTNQEIDVGQHAERGKEYRPARDVPAIRVARRAGYEPPRRNTAERVG